MSDNIDAFLDVAQRILRLKAELVEAEAQLSGLVRGARPATPQRKATSSSAPPTIHRPEVPVAQRVAKVLAARGALTFAEVFSAVQPAKRGAVKSALQAGRGRGEYALSGDRYQYKKKGPGGSSSRADGVASLEVT